MNPKEIFDRLKAEEVPGVEEFLDGPCDSSIRVDPKHLPEVLAFLKDDPECLINQLSLISGVDYEDRFECVYHLISIPLKHDVVVKVHLSKEDPSVPTASFVHPTANWHERETFDLVGIRFEGHPDPRRIYLPEDWEGHPLRKDYVFPKEYNGIPLTDLHGPEWEEPEEKDKDKATDQG
jgi:NADH-quinone oxidoreductase subunit C